MRIATVGGHRGWLTPSKWIPAAPPPVTQFSRIFASSIWACSGVRGGLLADLAQNGGPPHDFGDQNVEGIVQWGEELRRVRRRGHSRHEYVHNCPITRAPPTPPHPVKAMGLRLNSMCRWSAHVTTTDFRCCGRNLATNAPSVGECRYRPNGDNLVGHSRHRVRA